MATDTVVIAAAPGGVGGEASRSAVSWGAVIAGAFAAAAASLILFAVGSGFGLATASPWPHAGASAAGFAVMGGVWLIVTQWIASGVGGYLTGRLRTRWSGVHTHEVFFRDTANGLITWSVATVMVAFLIAAAASLTAGAAARGAAGERAGPQVAATDALFRSVRPDDSPSAPAVRAEAGRVLAKAAAGGAMSPDDRAWLAGVVAARTGVAPADAQSRVDSTVTAARDAADKARKSAAAASVFTALALLIGALIACVAAALGGQQRDEHL
jgi:hypothetical protein